MPVGSYGWRSACYHEFGWTPREVKQALLDFPGECARISIEFEETGAYLYKQRKQTPSASDSDGWTTDEQFGDEDEEPYYGDD